MSTLSSYDVGRTFFSSLVVEHATMMMNDDDSTDYDESMFRQLVEQWYDERNYVSSSLAETIACPSYLRIIGMGRRSVPFIIDQLKRERDEPDHWGAALEAITGENPVPREAYGDPVSIANAWITWADKQEQFSSLFPIHDFLNLQETITPSRVHETTGTIALRGPFEPQMLSGGRHRGPAISGHRMSDVMGP